MMAHHILETPGDLAEFTVFLGSLKLPVTVEWVRGRDRSRDQNALQWLWATEVANQRGDRTAAEVQQDWKLRHGVPILRMDSGAFREVYDRCIKPLSFEKKRKRYVLKISRSVSISGVTACRCLKKSHRPGTAPR